jgi:TrmH family RNA methyltransferase
MRRRPTPRAEALANLRVVLVRPRGGVNVGAAARAMKNMGLADLVLVAPALRRLRVAEVMAVHARDIVRDARIVAGIDEAVADCQVVVGTTCRGGTYRAAAAEPAVLAPELVAQARRGRVALLFGPEDHGLTNDDLRHCQRLISIDSDPAYASLNLAQAVLLVCYELRRAALHADAPGRAEPPELPEPAAAADVERMFVQLQTALRRIGFLNPQNPEHIMFALRQLLGRTTLAEHEVRILLGIARQIEWYGGRHVTGDRLPVTGGGSDPLQASIGADSHDPSTPSAECESVADRSPVTGHRSRTVRLRHG